MNFFDALMLEKTPNKDRRGALYFKSHVVELQAMLHASDTVIMKEGDGLTPLAI